jgi:hypothetical protein
MLMLIGLYLYFICFILLFIWSPITKSRAITRFNVLIAILSFVIIDGLAMMSMDNFSYLKTFEGKLVLFFTGVAIYCIYGLNRQKRAVKNGGFFVKTLRSGEYKITRDEEYVPTGHGVSIIESFYLTFEDTVLRADGSKVNFTEKDDVRIVYIKLDSKYILQRVDILSERKLNMVRELNKYIVLGCAICAPYAFYVAEPYSQSAGIAFKTLFTM